MYIDDGTMDFSSEIHGSEIAEKIICDIIPKILHVIEESEISAYDATNIPRYLEMSLLAHNKKNLGSCGFKAFSNGSFE